MAFTLTIVAMVIVLALCWRFLGAYMVAVYEGRAKWLKWLERPIYRVLRVDPEAEQTWPRYATSVIVFSGVALLLTYAIFRLQGHLPFNPSHFPGVRADTAWNTSVSFVTNTNWQSYSGEVTMSYLSQMGALAVQNFLSAAVGMAVAVALIRGFARKGSKTIGNFWVDLVRGTVTCCCRSRLSPRSFSSARARCKPSVVRFRCTTHSLVSTRLCYAARSPRRR
jgi:potassium-transporting ATPase potassium-binding subunit